MIKHSKLRGIYILISICISFSPTLFAQTVDPTLPTPPEANIGNLHEGASSGNADAQEGLQLSAIYFHAKKALAIINGKVVGINEDINGYTVIAIDRQSVKLASSKGESIILSLDNLEVKKFHRQSTGNKHEKFLCG